MAWRGTRQTSPADVWRTLSGVERYGQWVAGTSRAERDEGQWPGLGAALRYEIKLGLLALHHRTVVRRSEPDTALELEADSGTLGAARIAIELRHRGEDTLIIFDEHPLRGAGRSAQRPVTGTFPVVDALFLGNVLAGGGTDDRSGPV